MSEAEYDVYSTQGSLPASLEAYVDELRKLLYELQREYEAKAKPLVDELAKLEMLRAQHTVLIPKPPLPPNVIRMSKP